MKKYDVYKWEAEYKLVCVVLYEYIYMYEENNWRVWS